MSQVTIRPAKSEDWQVIQKLNAEVFEDNAQYDQHLNLQDPYTQESAIEYKQQCVDPKYCCLIAEAENVAVGYLVGEISNYSYRNNVVGKINHMGTSPNHRSHGVGSQLVSEFRNWAKQQGATHLQANSYYHNQRAINFYQKQGMEPIDITLEGKI